MKVPALPTYVYELSDEETGENCCTSISFCFVSLFATRPSSGIYLPSSKDMPIGVDAPFFPLRGCGAGLESPAILVGNHGLQRDAGGGGGSCDLAI